MLNVRRNGRRRLKLPAGALLYSLILIVGALSDDVGSTTIGRPFTCNATSDRVAIVSREPLQGFLVSPNYPEPYPAGRRCTFLLEAPDNSGLVLHFAFIDLDLEDRFSKSSQCLRDYIRFMMTDREGREHVGPRICGGNKLLAPIRGMQSKVEILLVSSLATARRRGFKIRFEFVPESEIGAPPSVYGDENTHWQRECGGTVDVSAPSAEIRSPGFPTTYPHNVTCNWLIRVEPHERVYVRLIHLELSPTVAECERASLTVVDGYHYTLSESMSRKFGDGSGDGHAVKYCGGHLYYNEEGLKSYLSNSNRVVVRFVSRDQPTPEQFANFHNNGTPIGFWLLWTKVINIVDTVEVEAPLAAAGNAVAQESAFESECTGGFLCKGGEFCIDNERKICAQRSRLCINATLQCNGVANCAENDDSDEYHCYSRDTVTLACAGLFVVVLTSTLLLISARSLLRWGANRRRLKNMRAQYAAAKADAPAVKALPPARLVAPLSDRNRTVTPKSSLKSRHSSRNAAVEAAVESFNMARAEYADDIAVKNTEFLTRGKNVSSFQNSATKAESKSSCSSEADPRLHECNCDGVLSRILADEKTIDAKKQFFDGDVWDGGDSNVGIDRKRPAAVPTPPRRRFYGAVDELNIKRDIGEKYDVNTEIGAEDQEPPIWQLAPERRPTGTGPSEDDRSELRRCRDWHRYNGQQVDNCPPLSSYQQQHSDGAPLGRRSDRGDALPPPYLHFNSCDRNLIVGYMANDTMSITADLDIDDVLATVIQV